MARLSTCKSCGIKIESGEKKTFSNKTYCLHCYEEKMKERAKYDNLLNYIGEIFHLDIPNGLIMKQIREYVDKYKYTYTGIQYCLWYMTSVKNKKMDIKYGIALVKFEYENAKAYYTQQEEIKNSANVKMAETKFYTLSAPKKSEKINKFIINLDEIGGV